MIDLKEKTQAEKTPGSKKTGKTGTLGFFASIISVCIISVATFIASWAAAEFIFALAHIGEDTVAKPDPLLGYSHIENQKITFRSEGYSRSQINARGFRDRLYAVPKPAGTTRICVVGDSMTMGLEVPLEKTFPKLLEKRLQSEGKNIEVLNCGMSGTGTGQQFLGYRKSIQALEPDILIVAYHLGDNDDNVGGGTNPPRPTFMLDATGKLRVDFRDVDKFFSGENSRFYSSFGEFRRKSRVLAVLSKADLDLHQDPAYKLLSRFTAKPSAYLWSRFLKLLPAGDWHLADSRKLAADLLPEPAAEVKPPAAQAQKNFQATASSASSAKEATVRTEAPATATTAGTIASSSHAVAARASAQPEVQRGQQDIELYRGMLYMHNNRMVVTREIIRRLNQECRSNNCQLVIAGLPAYDNTIMYYRELNELRKQAGEDGFIFLDSWGAFPPRGPVDDSPFHFSTHFNCAGHERMCESLYKSLFQNKI